MYAGNEGDSDKDWTDHLPGQSHLSVGRDVGEAWYSLTMLVVGVAWTEASMNYNCIQYSRHDEDRIAIGGEMCKLNPISAIAGSRCS